MKTLLSLILLAPVAFAADLTGRFDPGTTYEAPSAHAPAAVSRMYARAVPRISGHGSIDLPAAGDSGLIIVTSGPGARLTTPGGAVLRAEERGSLERGLRRFKLETGGEVLHVSRTAASSYRLELDIPEEVPETTVVAAEPDSALTLSTWAMPPSRQPGEPVTLHAELRDGEVAITGATVTARLASPRGRMSEVVTLEEEGDGVYSLTLPDLPEHAAGSWQVRFDAEGTTRRGVRFLRTGSGELIAERGAARLGQVQLAVEGNLLHVQVPADVVIAGNYRIDVIVARDGKSLAWAEGARQLQIGETTLSIDLPLSDVGGIDQLFADVRLLGLDEMGVAGRVTTQFE